MKTLGSLLLLATLVAFYSGQLDAHDIDGTTFKGYAVDCTVYTKACKADDAQVCGMDGKTHPNECEMCNSLGAPDKKVCAKHKGNCDRKREKEYCTNHLGVGCSSKYHPHCGSDGQTYPNKCDFCNHKAQNSSLELLFKEHCYNGRPSC